MVFDDLVLSVGSTDEFCLGGPRRRGLDTGLWSPLGSHRHLPSTMWYRRHRKSIEADGCSLITAVQTLEIDQAHTDGLRLDKTVSLGVSVMNLNDFEVSLKGLKGFTVTGAVDKDHQGCTFVDNVTITTPCLNPRITTSGGHESVGFGGGTITLTNNPNLNQIACRAQWSPCRRC